MIGQLQDTIQAIVVTLVLGNVRCAGKPGAPINTQVTKKKSPSEVHEALAQMGLTKFKSRHYERNCPTGQLNITDLKLSFCPVLS